MRLIWVARFGARPGLRRPVPHPGAAALHRDPRRGRGHPLCRRPEHAGHSGGGLSCPGLCAAPHRGHRPGIRIPPSGGAGRPGGRPSAGGLRLGGGTDPVHHPQGGFLRQHPHAPPRGFHPPHRAHRPAPRRRVHPPHPGGRSRTVFHPRRHRGPLRPRHEAAGAHGVLGRRDRYHAHLRSDHPAPGGPGGEDLCEPRPGGAVRCPPPRRPTCCGLS